MTRRCSHCSHNGHNSRTCPNRGVKLFGVRLTDGSIRKSASMGNLSHFGSSSLHQNGVVGNTTPGSPAAGDHTPDHLRASAAAAAVEAGYGSEDFVPGSSSSRDRKKGIAWTEEEHRMFLLGLQKLGKGDWRGISRNYVMSRTPTQVASHAQKYFIRQSNVSRRKRRSSLFDIVADDEGGGDTEMVSHDFLPTLPLDTETENPDSFHPAPSLDEECESMASTNSNSMDPEPAPAKPETSQSSYPSDTPQNYYPLVYPTYVSPFYPYPIPLWTGYNPEPAKEMHEVVKPTAVHSKNPINVDELVGMSKLSLGETIGSGEQSSLSKKLLEGSSRQSAFQANPAPSSSGMNPGGSPIHAV
ncbi:transcription factor MYBS3-like [Silene latifolia]|uniref:transcription factor MYBS3-like n=1 Tax=Silene latifolia TaxID=37657 RepID=UPI003D7819BB